MKWHSFIEKLMPPMTRRRWYDLGVIGLKTIVNEGWRSFWWKFRKYIGSDDVYESKFTKIIENQIVRFVRHKKRDLRNLPRVAIIIVTYNSEKTIRKLLESIIYNNYPFRLLEVIIVDNNSNDNTKKMILSFIKENQHKLHINLITNEKNCGFGKAVNTAVKHTDCDYILLLNPDCQLFKETINELVSAALCTRHIGFCLWEARQFPFEHPKIYNPVTLETSWSSAACCLICKKAFEVIGGFDDNIFLYLEDVDLSWRLRLNGYKLMYVPFANIIYETYETAKTVKRAQYYNSMLHQFYLRYKYGGLSDILKHYLRFLYLMQKLPNNFPYERLNLIKIFLKHYLLIPKSILFRISNYKKLKSFKPLFANFGFEVHRVGAFLKSSINVIGKSNLPKVCVIVRTVGREGFLREALVSLRNQTYGNIEIVIVEDGPSTIRNLIESEFTDINIKYFSLGKRYGRCRAGNFGLSKCSGRYICFLDEDDLLYSDHIEAMVSFISRESRYKLAYSLAFEVPTKTLSEKPLSYIEYDYKVVCNEDFNRNALLHHNYIPIQCALFDKNLYENYGGFDENLEYLEDWDLWIKYSQHTDFVKVPKVLSIYRVPADRNTRKERREKLGEYCSVVRNKWLNNNKS